MIPVFKKPQTAKGKKSSGGYLDLIRTKNGYETVDRNAQDYGKSELNLVFENGKVLRDTSFNEIRTVSRVKQ